MTFENNCTVPKMLLRTAEKYSEIPAQYKRLKDGNFEPVTYRNMIKAGLDFGAGLLNIGVKRGDPVGLISDNRAEWFQADLGIMGIGAHDVPRGCDATLIDLEKILAVTNTKYVITENSAQINKILSLKDKLPDLKVLINFENEVKSVVLELAKK